MSVTVKGVSKSFGSQKALDNISFQIERGEVVGFLGPNGAGKSTMMKIATGYLTADAGTVEVCGANVSTDTAAVRKMVGYLPEHNPLYLDMYVREYLSMVAGMYAVADTKSRVAEMIERTGLESECHKRIGALSKGYRQRVGLAQALMGDPQVVILDEPTTGLDPNQILEIRELIKNVGRERTVMLSTHIMQEVEAICDRVVIIDHGRLLAEGRADTISVMAKGGMTVEVEFDRRADTDKLKAATGADSIDEQAHCTYRLTHHGSNDIRPAVFRFAVDNGLVMLKMTNIDSNMEAIFHKLTTGN